MEIERMRMCVEFGRSSLLAEEHAQCLLEAKWVDVVVKAIWHWDTESTECIIFLKMAFNMPEPSVVLFVGVYMIQCHIYAVFAFAPSYLHYFHPGQMTDVWFIYYHIDKKCMFMCYSYKPAVGYVYW
jgi:hypothetical protein